MQRVTQSLHISVPIPIDVPSKTIIHLLHDHETLLSLQPLVVRTEKLPDKPDSAPDMERYSFTESIPILPFLGTWGYKESTSTAELRDVETGVEGTAHAPAGIVVGVRWVVEEENAGEQEQEAARAGRVLREDLNVECAAMMMWFLKGQVETSHREMCNRIILKCQGKV